MSESAGSTIAEVAGSHAIYVLQPDAVAKVIEQAASAASNKAASWFFRTSLPN